MSTLLTSCRPAGDPERWVGDPVDVITGAQTDRALDFQLHGAFDVLFYRHYDSRRCGEDAGLGPGFRHGFDHRLSFDVDGLYYQAPDGREASFPFITQVGQREAATGFFLALGPDGRYSVTASDTGDSLHFQMDRSGHGRLDAFVRGEHWIRFAHDGARRLSGFDSSSGYSVSFEWDSQRLVGATWCNPQDGKPRSLVRYQYDALGRLSAGADAYGHTFGFTYDGSHRMARRTDRNGYTFEFSYDAAGRCVRSRGQDGVLDVALSYDPAAHLTKVTHGDGGEWLYFYDDQATLLQVTDPYGGTTVYSKNPETGRVDAKIDAVGNVTKYVYDETGLLIALVSPTGERYAPGDAPPKAHHDVAQNAIEWELGQAAPRDFTLPEHAPSVRSVSAAVRQSLMLATTPGTGRFEPVYDAYGTLLREQRADGANRRFAYDANGNLRTYVDAEGRVYRQEYSSFNHLTRDIDPLGHTTGHGYDANEQRSSLVDAGGTHSSYVHDKKDRLVEVHRHGKLRERYVYDAADRLIEKQGSDGKPLMTWTYGAGPRKATRALASGEQQSFSYDARSRLIAAEGDAGALRFAYNEQNARVRDLRDGKGVEHHGQWLDSHVLGRFVTRVRRIDARSSVLVDPTGQVHRLVQDAHGVLRRELANGVVETTQYHPDGMPLMKALERSRVEPTLWVRRYHYDAEGNLLRAIDTQQGPTTYAYDGAGRLAREESADGSVEPYQYDEAGNLLRMPGLSEGQVVVDGLRRPGDAVIARGAGNRIHRANGDLFHYDPRDHVAMRLSPDGAQVRYRYDSFDQLVAVEAPGLTWSAKYDVLGRRTEKTVNGERWQYYWDTDRLAAECFPDGRVRIYVYAAERALVPWMFVDYASAAAPVDSGEVCYLFTNHLGCPELVTDARGKAVWRANIAPYGKTQIELGHDFHQPLRWPGHFYDAETGLHYNRFRYYDPALGRYLQSDPDGIRGGANLYAYTENPLRQVDVRGLGCPKTKKQKSEEEDAPEQESNDAAIRKRHGEEWGVDPNTGKLDPHARFQGKTLTEVDALARGPARDGEPEIVSRRRRYLAEKTAENKEPMPVDAWTESGYRANTNRDRSSPHETGAMAAVGARPNNASGEQGGQQTHTHNEWVDKNGRPLGKVEEGKPPPADASGQRTTTTRPDGTRGNDVVEHKHMTGEDTTLHDSQQMRAQRDMADKQGGRHEVVMSSDKPPLANGDPPVKPSDGAASGRDVKYYDTSQNPPKVTHEWDRGAWKRL